MADDPLFAAFGVRLVDPDEDPHLPAGAVNRMAPDVDPDPVEAKYPDPSGPGEP
jgi:hypothetical protein